MASFLREKSSGLFYDGSDESDDETDDEEDGEGFSSSGSEEENSKRFKNEDKLRRSMLEAFTNQIKPTSPTPGSTTPKFQSIFSSSVANPPLPQALSVFKTISDRQFLKSPPEAKSVWTPRTFTTIPVSPSFVPEPINLVDFSSIPLTPSTVSNLPPPKFRPAPASPSPSSPKPQISSWFTPFKPQTSGAGVAPPPSKILNLNFIIIRKDQIIDPKTNFRITVYAFNPTLADVYGALELQGFRKDEWVIKHPLSAYGRVKMEGLKDDGTFEASNILSARDMDSNQLWLLIHL